MTEFFIYAWTAPSATDDDTLALWYSNSTCDLCVGGVALQKPNVTHAAQMTFSTPASKDNVGYTASISRCHCSLTQGPGAPGVILLAGISHKSAVLWLLIWKHGGADPIAVVNRMYGLIESLHPASVVPFIFFVKLLRCTQIHKPRPKISDCPLIEVHRITCKVTACFKQEA